MKVTQAAPAFKPVVITVETEEELDILLSVSELTITIPAHIRGIPKDTVVNVLRNMRVGLLNPSRGGV